MQSLFIKATKSGWYPEFLRPVVEIITGNAAYQKILDIGTGPGTLPQMLIRKDPGLQITGIDINTAMIDEGRKKMSHKNISFQYARADATLEFDDTQFDIINFCSVLFLLDDNIKSKLMKEALRVLNPGGKIIILTPSGKKSVLSSFSEVWRYDFSFNNFTFLIWKTATTNRGRNWQQQKWPEQFAKENKLNYTSSPAFDYNASIETIF